MAAREPDTRALGTLEGPAAVEGRLVGGGRVVAPKAVRDDETLLEVGNRNP